MNTQKLNMLVICVHNSARSQMAAAFLEDALGDRFNVESAGLEPGTLNPYAVRAMKEIGIDISGNKTQSAFDKFKEGKLYAFVMIVCSEAEAAGCPIFPDTSVKLYWPFPDPSKAEGSDAEIMDGVRDIRDQIKNKAHTWAAEQIEKQGV